jgi:GNAT superfamily N-acetyltransferase
MSEIEVRPVVDEAGTLQSLQVWNAVVPLRAFALEDVVSYQGAVVAHVDMVAWLDGEAVGSAFVAIEPTQRDRGEARAQIAVLPHARRRGVGTALYEAMSQWARDHDVSELEAWVHDDDEAGADFGTKRGYVERIREAQVALDLTAIEAPAVEPPDGIAIVTLADRPDLTRGMYDVACEGHPDIPGSEDDVMEPYEDWLAHDLGGSGDKPEATFVALAGDEVVGYAKFHLSSARPRSADHDLTAVKRAWRGRGIATALKATQIAWAKAEGYEQLVTGNELRNTPIRRLNAKFGYRPIPGRALMRGPLAPSAQ